MADRNPMCREEHCEEPMDRCLDCPRRKRPTDPAPRGADAPDYAEADAKATEVMGWSFALGLSNLARAYLALRSPVPAEATSGAPSADTLEVERITREVAEFHKSGSAPDWHPEDVAYDLSRLLGIIARLRTPPAPLPREGAMRTEIESAMRELLDIRMDDLRCPVGITDEAFAGAALGAWKRIRYAMEHLTVALTPAAPTTTKETR